MKPDYLKLAEEWLEMPGPPASYSSVREFANFLQSQEAEKGEKCNCKEMSCPKDCKRNHTHKGYFCDICEPVASSKMNPSPLEGLKEIELPQEPEAYIFEDCLIALIENQNKIIKILKQGK